MNSSISVTEEGIVICFKLLQCLKEQFPIFVTDEGMKIFFNDIQSSNANLSIDFIEGGIIKVLIPLHPLKNELVIRSFFNNK